MASVDRIKNLPTIIPAAGSDGVRAFAEAENNHRTERFLLRVRGQVDITVAGTGLRNRGSILAAAPSLFFSDGGTDKYFADSRLANFVANMMANSALPFTRLANAGVQVATQLEETVPIWLSAARTANPNDTKYVEPNKQSALQVGLIPNRAITQLATGATGTITNLTVTLEQVYDDLLGTQPWVSPFVRQVIQNVNGANSQLRVDLRGSRYIRAIAIMQDTDQGEVSDIINGLVLRGDDRAIIGDRPVPFLDLNRELAQEYGGEIPAGYYLHDFCRYGRLSTMFNPYEDTNLRLELDCQPSAVAGATGSKVRVFVWEYEPTPATLPTPPVSI